RAQPRRRAAFAGSTGAATAAATVVAAFPHAAARYASRTGRALTRRRGRVLVGLVRRAAADLSGDEDEGGDGNECPDGSHVHLARGGHSADGMPADLGGARK